MSDLRPRTNRSSRPVGIARHGQLKKSSPWPSVFTFIGASLVVALVSVVSVGSIVTAQLTSDVKTVVLANETPLPPPTVGAIKGGFNILIVGSDQCETKSGCRGAGDRGSGKLNDVTMLLHVSEDQTNAVAVSFPRDMVVPIPSCPKEDGSGSYAAMSGQAINVTLSYGGLPCTVLTVEALTGLDVQYAGLVTFNGVIALSNAVGGVKVCITKDLVDPYTDLSLTAGTHTLKGKKALDFLRSRHGIGDGSDLTRISSQQVFLSSLVRTLKSKDTLSDPLKVYKIARAATKNMTLSSQFSSIDTLASVAFALKDIPLDQVTFVQYPGTTGQGGIYAGKVMPLTTKATELFNLIRSDTPFQLDSQGDGRGSVENPDAEETEEEPDTTTASNAPDDEATSGATDEPTDEATEQADTEETDTEETVISDLRGQTAADQTCSVPR